MTTALRHTANLFLLTFSLGCHAETGAVAAQSRSITPRVSAYAEVVSAAKVQVRASAAGIIADLAVRPGDHVVKGDTLARLTGAEVNATLTRHEAEVTSARAAVTAARKTLAIDQEKRSAHLGTRATVYAAKARLSGAQSQLDTARAELRATRAATGITAPLAATVLSVARADGEHVQAGEPLLTLQGAGALWLRGVFYASEAAGVHVGMTGGFQPVDGGEPIPVKVRGVVGRRRPDGGEIVALVPTVDHGDWRDGQAGTVTLDGPQRDAITVPTRALILDQGQWWVVVVGGQGEHRRRVVPGKQIGGATVIEHGLNAQERVLVNDAYLHYHRDFAAQYAQPD